jgi:hypothetical protein
MPLHMEVAATPWWFSRKSWGGRSGGHSDGNPNNPYKDHQCQVYGKLGHTALKCWKHFAKNYTSPEKSANVPTSSYNLDPAWYADSATMNHITGNLDKLTIKENYGGSDQVHIANVSDMMIKHTGHSIVSTPSRRFYLNNVLHVPQATRNLASVHRLTSDNDVFLEPHPPFFLIKGQHTRRMFLHVQCRDGLYPIPVAVPSSCKMSLSATKPSTLLWHGRLGHSSFKIVGCMLHTHELPFVSNKAFEAHVCDACQQAKSDQLPFPRSDSVSKAPLELVFFMSGPCPFLLWKQ